MVGNSANLFEQGQNSFILRGQSFGFGQPLARAGSITSENQGLAELK